jgi:hypothetical protein
MARQRPRINLTDEQRRLLDAFYCGHLSAGQLSLALQRLRGDAPVPVPLHAVGVQPQPTVEFTPLAA